MKKLMLSALCAVSITGCGKDLGMFTPSQVCTAALSTFIATDPSIISSRELEDGTISLFYYRKSDNLRFDNKCRLKGSEAIIYFTNLLGESDNRKQSKITYKIEDDHVLIREEFLYSDESDERYFRLTKDGRLLR